MKNRFLHSVVTAVTILLCPLTVFAQAPTLGSTACYALFSASGDVTNTGTSTITGNIGTNVGTASGFDLLNVTGVIHAVPDASTAACASDLLTMYNYLNALPYDIELFNPTQFGNKLTLLPNTYIIKSAAVLTDTLFLDAQGNTDAVFVIQIRGALTTGTYATVTLKNGAQAKNVFWNVTGAVGLNNYVNFKGTICNAGAITLNIGVMLEGRALTTAGALMTNTVNATMTSGCNLTGEGLHFRTIATGNWSNAAIWESSADSMSWQAANSAPCFLAQSITVRNAHTITVATHVTADQLTVNTGGAISVNDGIVLTIHDGAGWDVAVDGTVSGAGNMTLQSNATGTASVGPSSGSITIISSVERYIPNHRAWRMLTAPLSNTGNIYNAWQNNGTYEAGKGTLITGPAPSFANGLDASPANSPSMKSYNSTTQAFINVINTKSSLLSGNVGSADNIAYFTFIRGDRNPNNTNAAYSNSTTLRSTGTLQTGTQVFAAAGTYGQYTLMANPYAASIDFDNVERSHLMKRFYAWDPALNLVGGYVVLDDLDGNGIYSSSVPSSLQDKHIQSGQAFFVLTDTTGTASLTYYESSKSTSNLSSAFRQNGSNNGSFEASLNLVNNDGSAILADAVIAEFDNSFSKDVNLQDAIKFSNINETFSLLRNGKLLAIERRPVINNEDTLFLKINKTTVRSYQFVFRMSNMDAPGLIAILEDKFTGISTPLAMEGSTIFDFKLTTNAASINPDRFRIVFRTVGVLPVTYTNVSAKPKGNHIEVTWNVSRQENIKTYAVEKSTDGTHFGKMFSQSSTNADTYTWTDKDAATGDNYYRIRNTDLDGSGSISKVVKVVIAKASGAVVVFPNPVSNGIISLQLSKLVAGKYAVTLATAAGQVLLSRELLVGQGSSQQNIALPGKMAKGVYALTLELNGEKIAVVNVLIQ